MSVHREAILLLIAVWYGRYSPLW